jgi:ANTAR domain
MPETRRARIADAVSGSTVADLGTHTDRVCVACVRLVGVSGAGLVLTSDPDGAETICVTDPVTEKMEELQFALGEGPGVDAHHLRRPVREPDLGAVDGERWPAFRREALTNGIGAVFAFPLHLGVIRLGTLDLYRDRAGALDHEQLANALVLADVAIDGILDLQAQVPLGALHSRLGPGGHRTAVHQATGVLSVRLGVSMADALARLRAYAYASQRSLYDVAADVVGDRLNLD